MTTIDILAIGVIITFAVIIGTIFLWSLAGHREDRRVRLGRRAPDHVTRIGRFLPVLYVLRPGDDDAPRSRRMDDDPVEYSGSYRDPWA
jgi:hypothetical protein